MEQLSGRDLAKQVAYSINSFNFSNREFIDQMHSEHRTLQQNFMRLVLEYIVSTAETRHYDDRNEASVLAARKLLKTIEENHIYLPLI